MGNQPDVPAPETTAQMLQAYNQYLPSVLTNTAATVPTTAMDTYQGAAATQPLYNQLNLGQLQQYALPEAQVGEQVTNANAQAGAATNLAQIQGAGGQAATAGQALNQLLNPNYYNAQNAASSGAASAVNAIDLSGLSPGESAAVERANNQNLGGTGNLGLNNNTNTLENALNFGGAYNAKVGLMNNAVGAASGAANSAASNGGFNPVNIALSQPNTAAMGNFGTASAAPAATASNSGGAAGNAFGLGSGLMSNITSGNNAMTAAGVSQGNANNTPSYLNAMPSYS